MGEAPGGPWQAQHGYGYFGKRILRAEMGKKQKV